MALNALGSDGELTAMHEAAGLAGGAPIIAIMADSGGARWWLNHARQLLPRWLGCR